MKKSRIAKFALLGASAAALAATLSTSTYAWYVTNQTATVEEVTGKTSSASSAGAISLSATGTAGSFTKNLSIGDFANTASLLPVVTADGKTFYQLDENTDAVTDDANTPTTLGKQVAATSSASIATLGYGSAATGSVYRYRFFILAEGETTGDNTTTTVKPTITITNQTTTYKSQINYSAGALTPSSIASGSTFYANALNALSMSSAYYQGTKEVSTLTTNALVNAEYQNATTTLNSLDLLATGMSENNSNRFVTVTDTAVPTPVVTGGAKDYYEEISGNKLYDKAGSPKATLQYGDENNTSTVSALGNITINNMKPVLLEFYLWLDGADDACFNACEQQDIAVEFLFTVV